MKRNALVGLVVLAALTTAASAGTIHGKVSGVSGESVVDVEAIAGKTFSVPTQHVLIDQKGLMFVPHIVAIAQGTAVDFLNSDSVAHNVFWISINGNKNLGHKNLGTWPKGQKQSFKFENPGVVPLLCNVHPEMAAYPVKVAGALRQYLEPDRGSSHHCLRPRVSDPPYRPVGTDYEQK